MKTSIRSSWTLALAALGLALLLDQLFWQKPNGISFSIWISAVVLAGFAAAAVEKVRPAWRSYLLAGFVLLFAWITFFRREELTRSLSTLAALGLLVLLAATLRTGHWTSYRTVDYLTAFFQWLGAALTRGAGLIRGLKAPSAEGADGPEKPFFRRQVAPILRGLLLASPVIFVLTILLSSADPIFDDQVRNFFGVFRLESLGEYLFRLLYILVFAYLFAGTLMHAIHPQKEEAAPDPAKPELNPFLGFTESAVVLLCVDLLFLAFVAIQFRYLFGGQTNIAATAYTYSEYARRGFLELVTVAVISLLLYLALAAATRSDTSARRRAFTILSVALVAQVLVILASAWMRLRLYEDAYGFTRLRTYTHIFIPWLAALLAVTILLEILRRRGRFALFLLVCVAGFVLSLGLLNVDALIVRQNVQRAVNGEDLDLAYLASLSVDSVPTAVAYFSGGALPEQVHNQLGASLACRVAAQKDTATAPAAWTAVHQADRAARQLLNGQTAALNAYPVSWRETGVYEVKVNGETLPCQSYMDFD